MFCALQSNFYTYTTKIHNTFKYMYVSKVDDRCWRPPEVSLFNSDYTEV